MSKNIVVLADGTGQEGGEGFNTNIYKLFNMLEDRTERQVVCYDAGLGTNGRKVAGNAFGVGISENIQKCYRFIFDNYESGDKIYLLGFSRGAATVRSLSGFIHHFGILPQCRPELIKKAYAIYKSLSTDETIPEAVRYKPATDFIAKHHTMWTTIEFMGCFDTVAALGVSQFAVLDKIIDKIPAFQNKFHNFKLSRSVIRAYHALAIDDERKTFHPILWKGQYEDKKSAGQRTTQVWFCGMHTDVGGGYKEQSLSDIPLVWMLEKAIKYGVRLYDPGKITLAEDVDGLMHDSREGRLGRLYRRETRYWDGEGLPWIHQSVLDRANNPANKYNPWILDKTKVAEYRVVPWIPYADVIKNLP